MAFVQFLDFFQIEKIIKNLCSNGPPAPQTSPPSCLYVCQSPPDLHHGARHGDTMPLHCNTHHHHRCHLYHYSAPPQQTKLQTINSKQQEESPVTPMTHRFINGRMRAETPKRGMTRLVWDLVWGFFFGFLFFFMLKKGLRAGQKRVKGQ